MVLLRGRALQPVRPGWVIKDVLLGKIPLMVADKEETVSEACISDLHNTYQNLIKHENSLRPKAMQLRGMCYNSFVKLFKFAQLLKLVVLVREEEMLYPPDGKLLSLRKADKRTKYGVKVVVSNRRVFRLSDTGIQEERAWGNLCRAWIDNWEIPSEFPRLQVIPGAAPVVPPVVTAPPKVVKVPEEWKPFKWVVTPSVRQFGLLLKHLRVCKAIGIEDPRVSEEIEELSMRLGDWAVFYEDKIATEEERKAPRGELISDWQSKYDGITAVSEALMDEDLDAAIDELMKLV